MNKKKGLLSAFLAAALALSLFAGAVGAATNPDNGATLTVSKPDQFTTGVATEFTVSTAKGTYDGEFVNGFVDFDRTKVEKLEYFESTTSNWQEMPGNTFGPESGFPLSDATSRFRVTFKDAGETPVTIKIVSLSNTVLLSETCTFTSVAPVAPTLTLAAPDTFTAGVPAEFTVSTTKGDYAGGFVKGVGGITSGAEHVEKLEYYETAAGKEGRYELKGDSFGPASGFPLMDATSRFRVTFKDAGKVAFSVKIVDVGTSAEVLSGSYTFTGVAPVAPTLTLDAPDTFTAGVPTEFTVSTTKGDYAGGLVKGVGGITSGAEHVEKLEYYETAAGKEGWYELKGDSFGPASGFPLMDATSRFRVTFKDAGKVAFSVKIVTVEDPTDILSGSYTFTGVAKGAEPTPTPSATPAPTAAPSPAPTASPAPAPAPAPGRANPVTGVA